jgi:hypothetical protein
MSHDGADHPADTASSAGEAFGGGGDFGRGGERRPLALDDRGDVSRGIAVDLRSRRPPSGAIG